MVGESFFGANVLAVVINEQMLFLLDFVTNFWSSKFSFLKGFYHFEMNWSIGQSVLLSFQRRIPLKPWRFYAKLPTKNDVKCDKNAIESTRNIWKIQTESLMGLWIVCWPGMQPAYQLLLKLKKLKTFLE
jgi:hypothetical protein